MGLPTAHDDRCSRLVALPTVECSGQAPGGHDSTGVLKQSDSGMNESAEPADLLLQLGAVRLTRPGSVECERRAELPKVVVHIYSALRVPSFSTQLVFPPVRSGGYLARARRTAPTWAQFLHGQAAAILATDFFRVACSMAPRPMSWRSSSTRPDASGSLA
jgi:hypothetical protein